MKLVEWIECWKKRYSPRDLLYRDVQKALIQIQFRDAETEEIVIDEITYTSKDAINLILGK